MSISICLVLAVVGLSTALVFTASTYAFSGAVTANIISRGVVGTITATANHKYIQSYNEDTEVITYGNQAIAINDADSVVINYTGEEAKDTKNSLAYSDVTLRYGEMAEYSFVITNDSTTDNQKYRFMFRLGKYSSNNDLRYYSYKMEYWWTKADGTISPYYIIDAVMSLQYGYSNHKGYRYDSSATTLKSYSNNNGTPTGSALSTIALSTGTSENGDWNEDIELQTTTEDKSREKVLEIGCSLHVKLSIGRRNYSTSNSITTTSPGSFNIMYLGPGYSTALITAKDFFGYQ